MSYRKIIAILAGLGLLSAIMFSSFMGLPPLDKEQTFNSVLALGAETVLQTIVSSMAAVLFYPVYGVPFLVLWLIIAAVFFTLRLGFINIRMFAHAIKVVSGKYDNENDPGEVTHFQALTAAVSGTVGLGNIAGVAVAVSTGGPGAVVWMSIAGLFGMSTKFAEVTMGQKYREIDENGRVSGGAFHYLRKGLAEKNMPRLGRVLAAMFAVFCVGASLGGGNMFQSNQTVSLLKNSFTSFAEIDWIIALALAISVGVVLIGGIRRIASMAEKIVPLMALIYMGGALTVIIVNSSHLTEALGIMFRDAFGLSAMGGGFLGSMVAGFRRATFSNEAGVGSAPIAHAAAKTKEPVREGCVALLEPFLDTVVICFITGLMITVTGVYNDQSIANEGVMLTSNAFATVIDWFPYILSVSVFLFAYSTIITWSYYGERAWVYLFGSKKVALFYIIYCTATFVGGISSLSLVVDFSDLLLLSMAFPNLVGLYILSNDLSKDVKSYKNRLKQGEFDSAEEKTDTVVEASQPV